MAERRGKELALGARGRNVGCERPWPWGMTRSRALALWLGTLTVGACVAVAASCGNAAVEQPGADAEPDGERLDVTAPPRRPRDAAADAIDAEIDYDANPWDGEVPAPGAWKPIPGMPANCSARLAVDPKASVSRFPWKPCASGREGCEMFIADWGFLGKAVFRQLPEAPVFEDARGVHLTYSRAIYGSQGREHTFSIVQRLDGDAELAIFNDTSSNGCIPSGLTATPHGIDVVIGKKVVKYESFIGHVPLDDAGSLTMTRITDLLGRHNVVQGSAGGPGFVALEQTSFALGIYASAYRFDTGMLVTSTPQNTLESELPVPVSGGYFALVAASPSYVAFMPLTGGYQPVVRGEAGASVVYVGVDRTNNDALVWVESRSGTYTLFTAPFAITEATLARRAVARIGEPAYLPVVNAGLVLLGHQDSAIRAVRLSDGLAWNVPGETGTPILAGLWANAEYVWAIVSPMAAGTPGYPTSGGLIRVKRSTLGPPTVPSGL